MILGIDASNIRGGGGITHLVELLKAAHPAQHGFGKVVVWSGQETLSKIEERPWPDLRYRSGASPGNATGYPGWPKTRAATCCSCRADRMREASGPSWRSARTCCRSTWVNPAVMDGHSHRHPLALFIRDASAHFPPRGRADFSHPPCARRGHAQDQNNRRQDLHHSPRHR